MPTYDRHWPYGRMAINGQASHLWPYGLIYGQMALWPYGLLAMHKKSRHVGYLRKELTKYSPGMLIRNLWDLWDMKSKC